MTKNPNFGTQFPLIPGLRFFSKFWPCHFYYFIDLQLHAKFQINLMSSLQDIYRPTNKLYRPNGLAQRQICCSRFCCYGRLCHFWRFLCSSHCCFCHFLSSFLNHTKNLIFVKWEKELLHRKCFWGLVVW